MFILSLHNNKTHKRSFELFDSCADFQEFINSPEKMEKFIFEEAWHLMCNFGINDVTQDIFEQIHRAKVDVQTAVEGETKFESDCGEKMVFTIISASPFE